MKSIDYYREPGCYTRSEKWSQYLRSLPNDLEEIVKFIKKVLIHPLAARSMGVRFNFKKAMRSQLDVRTIDDILSEPKVHDLLSQQPADMCSAPAERGILSCDHHALLLTSILRIKGKAVRARCGYASYLIPEKYTPHWICEVFNENSRQWASLDPDQAKFSFREGEFIPAGGIWIGLLRKEIPEEQIIPDYRDGLDGVKCRLLNDINALMKNELLNYDWLIKEAAPKKPKLFSKSVSRLDRSELDLLYTLAELAVDANENIDNIRTQYATYVHSENLRESQ